MSLFSSLYWFHQAPTLVLTKSNWWTHVSCFRTCKIQSNLASHWKWESHSHREQVLKQGQRKDSPSERTRRPGRDTRGWPWGLCSSRQEADFKVQARKMKFVGLKASCMAWIGVRVWQGRESISKVLVEGECAAYVHLVTRCEPVACMLQQGVWVIESSDRFAITDC